MLPNKGREFTVHYDFPYKTGNGGTRPQGSRLYLVEESQLHEEDEAGHAQEHIGPEQHVDVVHEVHAEDCHLQHQLRVVGVCAPVLPHPVVVHVPQVDDVPVEGEERWWREGKGEGQVLSQYEHMQ